MSDSHPFSLSATFGEFSQEEGEECPPCEVHNDTEQEGSPSLDEGVEKDPAVMAWSAGPSSSPGPPSPPLQEQHIQLDIQSEQPEVGTKLRSSASQCYFINRKQCLRIEEDAIYTSLVESWWTMTL